MAKTATPGTVSRTRSAEIEHASLVKELTKKPEEVLETFEKNREVFTMLFAAMDLMVLAGNILDLVKKQAFYNADYQPIVHPIYDAVLTEVKKQWIPKPSVETVNFVHMCVGVATEATEILEHAHKRLLHGDSPKDSTVTEELGDLEFFMQGLRKDQDITRTDTLAANIIKLRKRYEQGYSDSAAQARADKVQDDTVAPDTVAEQEVIPPVTH